MGSLHVCMVKKYNLYFVGFTESKEFRIVLTLVRLWAMRSLVTTGWKIKFSYMQMCLRIWCKFQIQSPLTIFASVQIYRSASCLHPVRWGECREATGCEFIANLAWIYLFARIANSAWIICKGRIPLIFYTVRILEYFQCTTNFLQICYRTKNYIFA